MLSWIKQYQAASAQTKYFILNWLIYGLLIIVTTLYCYARLDYVRSYRAEAVKNESQNNSNSNP